MEIWWPDIEVVENDSLLGKSAQIIHSFVLHFDEVCNLPKHEAAVLAHSSRCDIQAFKLRQRPVWGVQPHPEIGIVEALRFLDKLVGSELLQRQYFLHAKQSAPKDSGWIVPLMREFQKTPPSGSDSARDGLLAE